MTDTSWRSLSTWTQLCLKPLTFHLEGHAQGRLKRPGHNHILRIAHLMSDHSKLAKLLDTNFPSPLPILRFLFLFYHIGLYIKKKKKKLSFTQQLDCRQFCFSSFPLSQRPYLVTMQAVSSWEISINIRCSFSEFSTRQIFWNSLWKLIHQILPLIWSEFIWLSQRMTNIYDPLEPYLIRSQ